MESKIKYSQLAQRKLKEREPNQSIVEKVLRNPDLILCDLISKTMVAIAEVEIENISTNLVIPYVKEDNTLKVVTIYPCRDMDREIKRKERLRWVRIR